MGIVENLRIYRSEKLNGLAKLLVKAGINANHITALSFLAGLVTAYFLFVDYYLFAIFALLHLCLDALDGVVARITKSTLLGKYFDLLSDNTVALLVLVKVGFYLQDHYAYLAAGLFLLALVIHLVSKLQSPITFIRTASVIVLVVATHPWFSFSTMLLTAGYLTAGGISVFSLARQLQWYVERKH